MLVLLAALLVTDTGQARPVVVAPDEVLNTVSIGEGPPVVLINGLLGGIYGYRKLMPALAALGYRVVAVEPLGLGSSSRPKGADYSLTAQADRIGRALDELGVRDALVIAHALGGSMAFRLAYRRPELVRGIISIDGGPAESAATDGLKRAMRWAPLLKLFVGRGTIRREVHNGLVKNSGDTTWLSAEVLDGYTAPPAKNVGATIDALRGMVRSHEPELLADRMSEIRVPVRLLIGTVPHESAVDAAETAEMRQRLADFAVDSIHGSGQLVHEEQPQAVLNALVALDRASRATPEQAGP
ncbi:MAG TPA: alpha/beta hydrolase [Gemmatimonadales bacterium]|nr:alpha/beta hydrolase [Gemmatimonadales bacterium]